MTITTTKCDKCGCTCSGEWFSVFTNEESGAVVGKNDICGTCFKRMLRAFKLAGWIKHEDIDGSEHYECSRCKNEFILIDGTPEENNYHYCPNCGADMRKETENE